MRVQRLRVTFGRGDEVKYITHLDIMRFWERALRRAALPLAYSQGYNPTPQISVAAPLPIGVTSSGEVMDVYLSGRVSPMVFTGEANKQMPSGFQVVAVEEVGLGLPSLQSQVRWAEYQVEVPAPGLDKSEIGRAITCLLELASLPWQHVRDRSVRRYDLRQLIDEVSLHGPAADGWVLAMRLRCDNQGTGRPEQVVAALGLSEAPRRIHRSRLIFAGTSPAHQARRRYSLYS